MGKRRFKIYVMTAALALCLCACGINSKSDMVFSDVRAYRDASLLDHDAEPDIPIITDGYYMMSDNHELIVEAFELLNKARDDNGLEALAWNQELETCACIRAEEIAYSFDKNHLRPMGAQWYTVNPGILLGENICRGPGDTEKVMKSWLENPADRENFLCPDLTEVAIGVYEDSEGHFYWACEFGNDSSQKSSSAVSDEKSASDNTGYIDHYHKNLEYIEGEWYILPDGSALYDDGTWDSLSFDTESLFVKYNAHDGASDGYSFQVADTIVNRDEVFECVIIDEVWYQLFLADNIGWDYMMLRPIGDADILAQHTMKSEINKINGCYVFSRKGESGDGRMAPADTDPKDRMIKGDIFYAIKWLEYGNSCTLQEMELWIERPELYGMNEEVFAYKPIDDAYRYCAINYSYKGRESECHDGYFDPQLVEVQTDENGEILSISNMSYAGEGYYYPYGEMAMDNTRDHQKFGAADKLYIGHWVWDKETESTLDIIPDSTDLGGYYVEFFLYRIADYRGNAALLDDGNLYFEGSFDGNNLPISGVIRKTDKGISFTVEKSDFEYVAEGEVYDYIREE